MTRSQLAASLIFVCGVLDLTKNAAIAQEQTCESRKRPAATPLQASVEAKLQPFKSCNVQVDDKAPCNVFVGRALELLFNNKDFKNGNQYLRANDIANGLGTPGNIPGWRKLGDATDQAVLDEAQTEANAGAQVVAVKPANNAGHVVLILPGTVKRLDVPGFSWGTLRAPNSASFFLNHPERVFVGCPLSVTWKAPTGVSIYVKK